MRARSSAWIERRSPIAFLSLGARRRSRVQIPSGPFPVFYSISFSTVRSVRFAALASISSVFLRGGFSQVGSSISFSTVRSVALFWLAALPRAKKPANPKTLRLFSGFLFVLLSPFFGLLFSYLFERRFVQIFSLKTYIALRQKSER